MKPTLKEIEDNYERVLLQLHNGHLAGIKKFSHVVEQQYWGSTTTYAIELEKGYKRESKHGYNIDRIKFLSDRNEVNEFMDYGSETDITDWDWDINNTNTSGGEIVTCSMGIDDSSFEKASVTISDDQMDAYTYSMFSTRYNITEIDDIIKGEKQNMMNGILSIYEEKQSRKINKKYDELEQSIKLTDERYKTWLDCTTTLTKLYKEDKVFMSEHFAPIQLSKDTLAKLHTLYDTREEDLRKLTEKRREVQSQLDMCETYDQKQEILRRYNIINKNGKVNG